MEDIKKLTREEEFAIICEDYLFPLVGVPFGGVVKIQFAHNADHFVELRDNNEIFLYESLSGDSCYTVQVSKYFPSDLVSLLDSAMKNINNVRHFGPNKKNKSRNLHGVDGLFDGIGGFSSHHVPIAHHRATSHGQFHE